MKCGRGACTAEMREDLEFARDAKAYNLPTRRFVCLLGHSRHINIVPLNRSMPERGVRHPPPLTWTRKRCARASCREWFLGTIHFSYCSTACQYENKLASKKQVRRRGKGRKPKAASQIRYDPMKRYYPL